jgi:hypothetical protein
MQIPLYVPSLLLMHVTDRLHVADSRTAKIMEEPAFETSRLTGVV